MVCQIPFYNKLAITFAIFHDNNKIKLGFKTLNILDNIRISQGLNNMKLEIK
jgi:hypothetical protein